MQLYYRVIPLITLLLLLYPWKLGVTNEPIDKQPVSTKNQWMGLSLASITGNTTCLPASIDYSYYPTPGHFIFIHITVGCFSLWFSSILFSWLLAHRWLHCILMTNDY